jgi:hypothetical protein
MNRFAVGFVAVACAVTVSAYGQNTERKTSTLSASHALGKQEVTAPDITVIVPPADPPENSRSLVEAKVKAISEQYIRQVVDWEGTADLPIVIIKTKGINTYCVRIAESKPHPAVAHDTHVVVHGQLGESCEILQIMDNGAVTERRFILRLDEGATVTPKPQAKPATDTPQCSSPLAQETPSWKTNYYAFVQAMSDAIRNAPDKSTTSCSSFVGGTVFWTLTYSETRYDPEEEKEQVIFANTDVPFQQARDLKPTSWVDFRPKEGNLSRWKSLKPGTTVSFSGKITRAIGMWMSNMKTGQNLDPVGSATVLLDEPSVASAQAPTETPSLRKHTDNAPGYEKNASALLPPYTIGLNGGNEVRIRNPNAFAVKAGIRSGRQGRDLDVPAYGVKSVFIPNGRFDIYFVYSDKPDALFQGDSFTLNNNGVEIQIVKVVNGNYGIRQVK